MAADTPPRFAAGDVSTCVTFALVPIRAKRFATNLPGNGANSDTCRRNRLAAKTATM
jgi:hypothetical protein